MAVATALCRRAGGHARDASTSEAATKTPYHCYFRPERVIIRFDASRLSLLPVSRAFADVLRRGDVGAGTARFRTRNRLGLSPSHQLAPRAHRLFASPNSLRASARNLEDFGKKRENGRQMAAEPGRPARAEIWPRCEGRAARA